MGFSRLCIRALVCYLGTLLESRAIVACKSASNIIGRSKTIVKVTKNDLLHNNMKKQIQNDPTLSQWPLAALVALAASWVPPPPMCRGCPPEKSRCEKSSAFV